MSFRRLLAFALLMLLSAKPICAGVVKPELPPSPIDGKTADELLEEGKFFEKFLRDSQKGNLKFDKKGNMLADPNKVALCPVCKQPLFKHSDPEFKCVPQGPRLPGPDERYAQPLEVHRVEANCPVCKIKFVAAYQGNINSMAGMDRDFCRHSVGDDFVVHSSMWLCPECGFSGFADRLNDKGQVVPLWGKDLDGSPLSPQTMQLVKERLKPYTFDKMIEISGLRRELVTANTQEGEELRQFGKYLEQTQIPDWLKYKNAVFLMENGGLKLQHRLKAQIYLEAAWSCRRQVCSEVSVTGPEFEMILGKSIQLMNRFIRAEALNIRQRRREGFVDPAKAETDPYVLAEACANIIKYGEQVVHDQEEQAKNGARPAVQDQARFQVGDVFVLRLREAGLLDRCGKMNEAAQTLEKTRAVIPLVDEVKQVLEAYEVKKSEMLLKIIEQHLKRLHVTIDERAECLKMEREYLFRAAEHLMQALFYNENPNNKDLATSVYWAGELYRRDAHELDVSKACFETALRLIRKQDLEGKHARLDEVIKQRKDPTKPGEAEAPLRAEIQRLETLSGWSEEHIAYVDKAIKARTLMEQKSGIQPPAGPRIRENISKALEEIEKRAGVANTAARPAGPELPVNPPEKVAQTNDPVAKTAQETKNETKTGEEQGPKVAPAGPKVASVVNTREDLYRVYYEALTRFVKDKKANPESLSELVSTNYLKAAEACLDENGVLICPETQQKLLYQKGAPFGDKTRPYIYPRAKDPNQKKLYGDGHIE